MTYSEFETLIATVKSYSTHLDSYFHGPQHWRCVALVGIRLARVTPGGDPLVALLFGLFHDSMRENDDFDPDHGERGAALFRKLQTLGLIPVTTLQADTIALACKTHTYAPPTDVVAIGCCYDADRLNLWRVGTTPDPDYLSTPWGRAWALTEETATLHQTPLTWAEVWDTFDKK